MGLLVGKQAVGCKWVFTIKVNPDGLVARLKARLVAKRYAQAYGVYYSDTFSSVAKLTFVCLFISLVAFHNWPLQQIRYEECLSLWGSLRSIYGTIAWVLLLRGSMERFVI